MLQATVVVAGKGCKLKKESATDNDHGKMHGLCGDIPAPWHGVHR
jgi:hypothetical protein